MDLICRSILLLTALTSFAATQSPVTSTESNNAQCGNDLVQCIADQVFIKLKESRTPIAFYAYYSKSFISLSKGSAYVYDTVEANLGNGYNKTSGIFTAPTSGLYAFTWTLHVAGMDVVGKSGSNPSQYTRYGEASAVLKQNGATKGAIAADTETKHDADSATGFVLLETKSGDQFQITAEFDGEGDVYSADKNGRTTFSGFRVA